MKRIIEIRSYKLKPGTRAESHEIMVGQGLPMLRRWGVDVVACGLTPNDENAYYLIRSYADLADLNDSQNAFYGSDEWRQGPREAALALIEDYISIVLDVDEATLHGLRSNS